MFYSKPISLCYAYRPPSSKVEWLNLFSEGLDKPFNENKETVIQGIFLTLIYLNYVYNSNSWLQLKESMKFTQLVKCPTRTTEYSLTLIDVFTNIPGNIIEINIPTYALSDHFPVAITRKNYHNIIITKPYHNSIVYRSVKNFSELEFLKALSNQHWSLLTAGADPDEYTGLFIEVLQNHVPI